MVQNPNRFQEFDCRWAKEETIDADNIKESKFTKRMMMWLCLRRGSQLLQKKEKKMQPSNYGELFKAGVIHHPENSRSVFFFEVAEFYVGEITYLFFYNFIY